MARPAGWLEVSYQPRDGNDDSTSLADASHRDVGRIDLGMAARRLDRSDRVGIHARVVVAARISDAARHVAGKGGITPSVDQVWRVARPPGATLRTGIHDQVRETNARPDQPLERVPASCAIADVFHDARQAPRTWAREQQPASNLLAAIAGEADVVAVKSGEGHINWLEPSRQRMPSRLGQRLAPEGIEVGRLVTRRSVLAQLLQG
jgi:hypothetical protein